MKRFLFLIPALIQLSLFAEIQPAEKLLPSDTLFVLTAPDTTKLRSIFSKSPQSQLWNDPAMKPFRENFMKKFTSDIVAPLEKELGVNFSDYSALAQGQFTFAITQNGWQGKPDQEPGIVLLLDTRDKSAALKTNLTALKKKWMDAGKQMKTEKIRDLEFTTIITSDDEMDKTIQKIFPSKNATETKTGKTNKIEITVGQSDSLLIVGNSVKVIEKILVKQSGGLVPTLSEDGNYEANHNALFRDANVFGWVNLKPLLEIIKSSMEADASSSLVKPEKMLSVLGLNGLKSFAVTYADAGDGGMVKFFIGAPESSRQGIVKMLVAETKDSAPPVFIPADAVKFTRWRLNLQKVFNAFEAMMAEISPSSSGVFKLIFENAGKDQDKDFDLRKELIGNLGDDLISYQKNARSSSLEDVNSPPSLYLLSSANAEKLGHALKVGISSLNPDPSSLKEREFLGRKVYSLSMPDTGVPGKDAKPVSKSLHFAASGGYVGITTDVAMLEEYLRSSEAKGKTLAETSGLKEAAEKVGGMGTGLFGFENQSESARITFDALKKNSGNIAALFGAGTIGESVGQDQEKKMKEWADFSLLPPFEAISKYFYFTVYGGGFDANGLTIKMYAPTPPTLKK